MSPDLHNMEKQIGGGTHKGKNRFTAKAFEVFRLRAADET